MRIRVTRRFQLTLPKEAREKLGIFVGDLVDVGFEDGRIVIRKVAENWEEAMKETAGAWKNHRVFGKMKNAVEIVHWLRGKAHESGN